MGPCEHCPRRETCTEPCEDLARLLDSPERGRLAAHITPSACEDAALLLDRADRLRPRDRAMIHLYYRSGFTMQAIAEAFGVHRSNVCRALRRCRRRLLVSEDARGRAAGRSLAAESAP